ncbi:MAG: sensor domain-containing diguanylate cyclase [Terriglobales bacterium]
MITTVNSEQSSLARLRQFSNHGPASVVGLTFGALMAGQILGFLLLGTGRAGCGFAESVLVLDSLLALACAWSAYRRAQGLAALFWFLFASVLVVLLIPTAFQAYDSLTGQTTLSDSTWRLLYCLYGAPILMMLFLPENYHGAQVKSEIILALVQIAIVVGLVYSTFFFLPARNMLPADALLHNITISDAQSLLLLIAVVVRLQFARVPSTRRLLFRLALFLMVCALATFIGDWIDLHHYLTASAWFNLGWAVPQAAAALVAITWVPAADLEAAPPATNFLGFLGTNFALVSLLCCVGLLTDRWKAAYGSVLADVAIAASLLAFTLRLALTQLHQQQEIAQRHAAQKRLNTSHQRIGGLLEDARRQTAEITQISELGSVLHACSTREEVFRLIPERLRRLFPGFSGSVALLSASGNRVQSAAEWGMLFPADQIFTPEECWALRRGRTHAQSGGGKNGRCTHLRGEGPSVCIPLIANGEAIGILAIQEDDRLHHPPSPSALDADVDSDAFARRRQLATTVAEHIALAVANVNLKEALRLQAIRDPLTGLYNRRYMQEFLERELHSARRKRRPLSVIMLDLDHFKRYNDNFGHSAGDQALAAVGEMLLRTVRAEDIACRYGGEEFTLILPECPLSEATVRAEEIRKGIKEYHFQQVQPERPDRPAAKLSCSIGVAAFDETTDRVDLLLKFADDALYQAKRAGRDRVVVARPAAALPEVNFTESASAASASGEKK